MEVEIQVIKHLHIVCVNCQKQTTASLSDRKWRLRRSSLIPYLVAELFIIALLLLLLLTLFNTNLSRTMGTIYGAGLTGDTSFIYWNK